MNALVLEPISETLLSTMASTTTTLALTRPRPATG